MPMLFDLGRLVITKGAETVVTPHEAAAMIRRHLTGDWGDLCAEDRETNRRAIGTAGFVMSAYRASCGLTVWIITEQGVGVTTILMPDEY